ncbi:hypothetical protein [Dactylosporangium sp. CS-033363]|uniref:hypothetical protein n=1 Tax=Dactylosporangium sp. CS-033363 TaxID=3239935 RepID=UPI003D8ABA21
MSNRSHRRAAARQAARTAAGGATSTAVDERPDPLTLGERDSRDRAREQMAELLTSPGFVDSDEDPDGVTFDFDKHWEAKRKEQKRRRVRIYGKVYDLPKSLPAKVMFLSQRKEFRDKRRKITAEEGFGTIREMLDLSLRPGAVDQMLEDGIEMDELPDVLAFVMGHFDNLGRQLTGEAPGGGGADPGEARGGHRPASSGS